MSAGASCLFAALREYRVLGLLGDPELEHALRGDRDRLTRRGVAAHPGLAVDHDKLADTRDGEAVARFLVREARELVEEQGDLLLGHPHFLREPIHGLGLRDPSHVFLQFGLPGLFRAHSARTHKMSRGKAPRPPTAHHRHCDAEGRRRAARPARVAAGDDPPLGREHHGRAHSPPRHRRFGPRGGALRRLGRRLGSGPGRGSRADRGAGRDAHRSAPRDGRRARSDRPAPPGGVRHDARGYSRPCRQGRGDLRPPSRRLPRRARRRADRSAPLLRRFELFRLAPHAPDSLQRSSRGAPRRSAQRALGEDDMATETKSGTALETFAREDRTFPPPREFAAQANAKDPGIYERAERDVEGFWAEHARTLQWRRPFTVVFGGFSAEALAGRINDSEAKVLVTADGGYRKGNVVPLKKNADDALAQAKTIEKVIVVKRTKQDIPWTAGRDVWWHEVVDKQKAD